MARPIVHALLTGLPRFGKDTDSLVLNLTNVETVNWFVVLWRYPKGLLPDTLSNLDPAWFDLSESELHDFIQQRLPDNHRLQLTRWVDHDSLEQPPRKFEAFYSNPTNTWGQYSLLRHANQLRHQLEPHLGPKPDIIVRCRADGGMSQPLDMSALAQACQLDPKLLITPRNQRHGHYQFCDHMAIGSDQAITALANVVTDFDRVNREGIPFNAELLIGHILKSQGLHWPSTEWDSTLKKSGYYDSLGVWHQLEGRWCLRPSW